MKRRIPAQKRIRAPTVARAFCRGLDVTIDVPIGTVERVLAPLVDLARTPRGCHVHRGEVQQAPRGKGRRAGVELWIAINQSTLREIDENE